MSKSNNMSRRRFIQAVGASAVAVPYMVPSSVMGQNAPSNQIALGFIGVGGQAQGLLGGVLSRDAARVITVCDVDKRALDETKNRINGQYGNNDCGTHHDFRDLLARKDVDAVFIATPDHWHAIPCIQAAKAGKDIYCEKPLTYTLEEGRAVVEAVQRHGVVFQTGSMQRAFGAMKQGCELVRNGYLGKIKHVNVGLPDGGHSSFQSNFPAVPDWLDYDFWVGPAKYVPYHPERRKGNWRWWLDYGGGQLMDWIGHHGDIAHMGLDYDNWGPSQVEPVVWNTPEKSNIFNAPKDYKINYKYSDGMTMTVANMRLMPEVFLQNGDTGTQWFGEDGSWVWVSRSGIRASDDKLLKIKMSGNDFRFRRGIGHIDEFFECIKTRQQPIAPVNAGHRSASIGHLGKIASLIGRKFNWDPATETADDDMANRLRSRANRGQWTLS